MSALPTLIKLTTPLGDKVLNFSTMAGVEELGRLFDYDLLAISTKNDLDPKALLGKRVTRDTQRADPRSGGGQQRQNREALQRSSPEVFRGRAPHPGARARMLSNCSKNCNALSRANQAGARFTYIETRLC